MWVCWTQQGQTKIVWGVKPQKSRSVVLIWPLKIKLPCVVLGSQCSLFWPSIFILRVIVCDDHFDENRRHVAFRRPRAGLQLDIHISAMRLPQREAETDVRVDEIKCILLTIFTQTRHVKVILIGRPVVVLYSDFWIAVAHMLLAICLNLK